MSDARANSPLSKIPAPDPAGFVRLVAPRILDAVNKAINEGRGESITTSTGRHMRIIVFQGRDSESRIEWRFVAPLERYLEQSLTAQHGYDCFCHMTRQGRDSFRVSVRFVLG